jgi:EpsI family protein
MRPRAAVCVAMLVAALLFVQFRSHGEAVPPRQPLQTFQPVVAGWQPRESNVFTDDIQNVLKASDYVMRRYNDASGRSLWLFIGYWETQRKGAQPHSPQNCLPGSGWEPLEVSRVSIPLANGKSLAANRVLIQKDQHQQLVYYWYQAQGTAVASELDAKLHMMKNAVLRNRTDGALVRVTSPIYGSVAATSTQLTTFVQALQPALSNYLPD